jgi:uncharacterized membrane protein
MSEHHKLIPPSIAELKAKRKPLVNVSEVQKTKLSTLDRVACYITDHVGSMGFFLIILSWTVLWCGYNILATEVPGLHWTSFDPFPAFVAYLLISNVIQILLMPLIMVGQNVQSQHSDLRAQSDLDVNVKAEEEIEAVLKHLELQNAMLIALLDKQGIKQDAILEEMHRKATAAKA